MAKRTTSLLRTLDRYLGVPLLYLLGKLRPSKPLPKEIKTIALLNTAAIGDTILLSGPISDLLSRGEVTFFTGPSNYEAALLIPGIKVIQLPVTSVFRSISLLRNYTFDVWIDCGQWARLNALYSYFAKARFKIGFKTSGQFRHSVYDKTVLHQPIHEIENYRNLIRLIANHPQSNPTLSLPPPSGDSTIIVIHMHPGGSRGDLKRWPENKWIELINRLTERGFQIQLTGTLADRPHCEKIEAACLVEIVAGEMTLKETALLLLKARYVISVDTGIMHLAAALGCPTVALHGPTSPQRWGGIGPHVHPITPKIHYEPCIHLGFEKTCSKSRCMESILVDQVLEVIK